jgi:hypothetical protein
MVLVVVTVTVALVAGVARGGRLSNLAEAPIRAGAFVAVAALAQFAHALVPGAPAAVAFTLLSEAALLAFLWSNRYLGGVLLAAIGSALNTAVIVANGAMPVSRDALQAIARAETAVASGRHRLLEPGDPLAALADVIALPVLRTVISVGDIILAAGLGLLVFDLLRDRPARGVSATSRPSR